MAIGFSWGSYSLSYAFIMYILISVSLGMYLIKYMYTLNKQISAMIVMILLILIFVFFGKRWFQYGQLKGSAAWAKANTIAQSNQSGSSIANGQCADGSSATSTVSTIWPPVVNYCPDFMTIDGSGACVDSNSMYGPNGSTGSTKINKYKGNTNVCSSITSTSSKHLRWEGVVQAEGSCNPSNIGKPPSN
jgi:hypothetical protein